MAALRQTRNPLLPPPLQHLIARLAADPKLPAKLRHRAFTTLQPHAEPGLLRHQTALPQRHRPNLPASSDLLGPVTLPPGLFCYPSCQFGPRTTLPAKGRVRCGARLVNCRWFVCILACDSASEMTGSVPLQPPVAGVGVHLADVGAGRGLVELAPHVDDGRRARSSTPSPTQASRRSRISAWCSRRPACGRSPP